MASKDRHAVEIRPATGIINLGDGCDEVDELVWIRIAIDGQITEYAAHDDYGPGVHVIRKPGVCPHCGEKLDA